MSWYKCHPDTPALPSRYIQVIIFSKPNGPGTAASRDALDREFKFKMYDLSSQFASNESKRTSKYAASYHPSVLGSYPRRPHCHFFFRNYKSCATFQGLLRFIRANGLGYKWSTARHPASIFEYLLQTDNKILLCSSHEAQNSDARTWEDDVELGNQGPAGDDAEWEPSEESESEDRELLSGSQQSGDEGSERVMRGDSDEVCQPYGRRPTQRARRNEAAVQWVRTAVSTLFPTSLSELETLVINDEAWLEDYLEHSTDKDFIKYVSQAMKLFHYRMKSKTWEELMHMDFVSTREKLGDRYMPVNKSVLAIKKFLSHNNINIPTFVKEVKMIMNKEKMKINTLYLYGEANSFKTGILTSIAETCGSIFNNNQLNGTTSQFGLQEATNKRVALLDEIVIDEKWMNKALLLLAGQTCNTDVKFESLQNISRIPILLASNFLLHHHLPRHQQADYERAWRKRCIFYHVREFPACKDFDAKVHPLAWAALYREFINPDGPAPDWYLRTHNLPEPDIPYPVGDFIYPDSAEDAADELDLSVSDESDGSGIGLCNVSGDERDGFEGVDVPDTYAEFARDLDAKAMEYSEI